ncbi:hypothetical protein [Sulfurirhabdus autotrophica]|uniref:Uncharacterized protein n=1 Tax=Sulfurirhabdus autotrophica TaxID=1706046 RepID=A0A4R3Y168_9PROT|nr:hypothetical protein [Sulfurirhabdus autotrophica]TCV85400.1 hypothetical protein EDC63_10971 [Sulfurirhabdus autotrophica]
MKSNEDFITNASNFLLWLEKEKGLRLCSAYKPQYEWYVPANFRIENLVNQFIDSQFPEQADVLLPIKSVQLAA